MEITDVRVRRVLNGGNMKAIASITFDDEFVVHNIKIIQGDDSLFIAMPSRKTSKGDFKDIAHPINSNTRNKLQEAVLKEYELMPEEEAVDSSSVE